MRRTLWTAPLLLALALVGISLLKRSPTLADAGQAPPAPPGNNWTATVTFDDPGTYVLRWHASDGALWADQNITVTVTQ